MKTLSFILSDLILKIIQLYSFLSGVFVFFLSPFNWIVLLLIIRWFVIRNRIKRILLIAALSIFLVFSNEFVFNTIVTNWQPKPVDLKGRQLEAGILLGGMSQFEKDSTGFFGDASDRFIQANKLYQQGIIKKIIISGGRIYTDQPKEATFIKQQLLDGGVPDHDIIVEDASRNTVENASYTKRIVDSLQLKGPLVLITSATHIPRAKRVFESKKIQVIPFPCDYDVINKKFHFSDYFWPDIKVLGNWKFVLKEWAGLVVYQVTGKA